MGYTPFLLAGICGVISPAEQTLLLLRRPHRTVINRTHKSETVCTVCSWGGSADEGVSCSWGCPAAQLLGANIGFITQKAQWLQQIKASLIRLQQLPESGSVLLQIKSFGSEPDHPESCLNVVLCAHIEGGVKLSVFMVSLHL